MTCTPADLCNEIADKNRETQFSTIPVVVNDRVLGLYRADRWFGPDALPPSAEPVASDYEPLSEDILITEDASIFDFVRHADSHPTNLVVRGTTIAGLVSLSDLQELPVRAALFTLVTSFEMVMADLIARAHPRDEEWKAMLTTGRRERLATRVNQAKQNDSFSSELLLTQFCDKRTILVDGRHLSGEPDDLTDRIKKIERLRDNLAHANQFAETAERAKEVCSVVRDIYDLKSQILNADQCQAGNPRPCDVDSNET